jgi:hypothetical protein
MCRIVVTVVALLPLLWALVSHILCYMHSEQPLKEQKVAVKMTSVERSAHATLLVDEFASCDVMKTQKRVLYLKYHPDKPEGSAKKVSGGASCYSL